MDQIKKIFKRGIVTSFIVLIYGVFTKNSAVYIGMFVGALISVLAFYMMYEAAQNLTFSKNIRKSAYLNYGKRYVIYLMTLLIMGYFGKIQFIVATAIGLFNIRINIFLLIFEEKFFKR